MGISPDRTSPSLSNAAAALNDLAFMAFEIVERTKSEGWGRWGGGVVGSWGGGNYA